MKIEGRAYTDEQKRKILDRIYEGWIRYPELRLGQLLVNASTVLFYREDEALARDVETFDPRAPDFIRADQHCVCGACGKEYRQHPHSEHRAYDGSPYLHRICDGTLVKL
jgi:hypothetical protein